MPLGRKSWNAPRVGREASRRRGNGAIYVSLTSIFQNQSRLVRTLQSMLDQSLRPDAIFLHLSSEPYLKDAGFSGRRITDRELGAFLERHEALVHVRWVENTGPYRKLVPLLGDLVDGRLSDASAARIITIDDDLEYHPDTVASLVESGAPCACLRGFEMRLDHPSKLSEWGYFQRTRLSSGSSVLNFATGVGGILYTVPAFARTLDLLRDDTMYRECCPTNDDIWFNFLRIVNEVPMTIIDAPYVKQDLTNYTTSLWLGFNNERNNEQIRVTSRRLREQGLL